ncbi:MAG: tetratricopeptide repeat protein [Chlorobi bacterium]|nr:tetratricopeptide repeat protein [Chlorobiota bacterium]
MEINETLIERYIRSRMAAGEQKAFEDQLRKRPELFEELQILRDVAGMVAEKDAVDFSERVNAERIAYESRKSQGIRGVRLPQWGKWIAAAVILILIGFPGWLAYRNSKPNPQRLMAQYYTPVEVPVAFRGQSPVTDHTFIRAMSLFRQNKYDQAAPEFEKVLVTDTARLDARLMLGVSYLEAGDYLRAGKAFEHILRSGDTRFNEEAVWSLGFCYLMSGKTDQAKQVFSKIVSGGGYYSRNAGKILKKLN